MVAQKSFTAANRADFETAGWSEHDDHFAGKYTKGEQTCSGIARLENGRWQFYILDCPDQILRGKHSACIHGRPDFEGHKLHWVHFDNKPEILSGIWAIVDLM